MNNINNINSLQTGIIRLDNFTGGLPLSNLTVLTTHTNLGWDITQLLAMNIAKNIEGKQNCPIALFNFKNEWANIRRFNESPTFLYPPYQNEIQRLCEEAERLKVEHEELSLMVVDGLQYLFSGNNYNNRHQRLFEVSKSLKALANELNLPIIACVPLNTQLDPKDIEIVEVNASLIIFLNEKEILNDTEKTIVLLKVNRTLSGYPGLMKLHYDSRQMRFD